MEYRPCLQVDAEARDRVEAFAQFDAEMRANIRAGDQATSHMAALAREASSSTADDVSKLTVRMKALEAGFAGEQHRAQQLQKENHQLKQEIAQLRRNGVKGLQARK